MSKWSQLTGASHSRARGRRDWGLIWSEYDVFVPQEPFEWKGSISGHSITQSPPVHELFEGFYMLEFAQKQVAKDEPWHPILERSVFGVSVDDIYYRIRRLRKKEPPERWSRYWRW